MMCAVEGCGASATVLVIEIRGVVVLVVCDEHARFSAALMGSKVAVRELRPDRRRGLA
jgi:hypothetical protein